MPQSTIAADIHQPLDVHLHSLTQVAFDFALRFQDITDAAQLVFTQVSDAGIQIDTSFLEHRVRTRTTNAVNVGQANLGSLVRWQIYSSYTCHLNSRYPCLCLCLGLTQITRTTPLRWMTLHLSHIFFTDARTFMTVPRYLFIAICDPAAIEIVWRKLH